MDIFNAAITSKISTDQIFEWLATDNLQSAPFSDIIQTETTKAEFIIYILDYVKKQCKSILQIGPNASFENKEDSKKFEKSFSEPSKLQNHEKVTPKHKNNSSQGNLTDTSISSQSIGNGLTSTPLKSNVTTYITSPDVKSSLQTACYPPGTPNVLLAPHVLNTPNQANYYFLNQSFSPNVPNDSYAALLSQSQTSNCSTRNVSLNDSLISNSSTTPNVALYSPTSPLHAANMPLMSDDRTNILTPKNKSASKNRNKQNSSAQKPNRNQKNKSSQNRNMCLGDFLSVNKAGSSSGNDKKTRSKRRIKPTQLKTYDNSENQQPPVFGVVNRPQIVNPQFTEAQPEEKSNKKSSFEAERVLLKLEKKKQPKIDALDQEPIFQNRPKLPTINVVPNVELVKNVEVLNILVNLYGGLLRKNLIPNLMTELYFIISLITSQYKSQVEEELKKNEKDSESDNLMVQDSFEALKINLGCKDINEDSDSPKSPQEISNSSLNNSDDEKTNESQAKQLKIITDTSFLNTAHNCVYFATAILAQEKSLLEILDRTTLKLLSDNRFVISFQPELQNYLNELYRNKYLQSKQIESTDKSTVSQPNVCFEVETDNRENFISHRSFSLFRQQRDLFYGILKTWEDRHLNPKWSFSSLEKRISTMLNIHDDSVNYYHLARLFKLQLLMSSVENKQLEQPINDEYSSILENMQHLDPNKLNQLKKRLVTPVTSTSIDPVPSPSFPGVQEFYRNFISVVSNPNFLTILEHCFIQEITELNETQFTCSDIEDKETAVEESTKQNYLLSVSNLRLMAKFLGLVISMPYRSEINSVGIISTQITIRSRILPPLDLQQCLRDALEHGKLTLVVPWIVQYLAMLDSIAFRLPYYLQLCEVLYYIYRTVPASLNHKAALLITFSIGWLFELPNFPKDLFYDWYTNYDIKRIPIFSETTIEVKKNQSIVSSSFKEHNVILDRMEIIDDRTLYACCPFLEAFKALLTSGNLNFKNSNVNRHITPVSSQLSQPSSATKAKMLQMQLQDAFFHGQPKSVKKTVDFVSERVASNCVKYICQSMIVKNEEKCFKIWKNKNNLSLEKKKDEIIAITKNIKEQCQEEITSMTQMKIKNAMESLLADDLLPAVKSMCIKIAQKMTMERINQWLDFYINNTTSYESIHEKYSKNDPYKNFEEEADDPTWKINGESYDPQAPSATSMIEELRNALWEVIEQHGRWFVLSEDQNLNLIQNLRATLYNREDALPSVKVVLYKMSIDYALHIIVFKKDLMTPKVEDKFIEVWKLYPNASDLFHNPLCTRNITLLMQTYDKTVWSRYGKFIGRLLTEDILSWNLFCEQCVAILRQEWSVEVLKLIPVCLMETLGCFENTNISTGKITNTKKYEKIKSMIEWIAETCSGLNSNSF